MSRVIVLEKVNGVGTGTLPVGDHYPWTYKTCTKEQAVGRAWRALKRDHPTENPMNWKVREEVSS